VPKITHNRAFPHENDEFDILVGTFDEDGDEDDTSYGFDDANDFPFDYNDAVSFNFQGTDGNDQFFGGPNGDTLKGGKGLDALYGEGGDDWIYGGDDTDWLFGDDGQDHVFGEDGCDQLYGGAGHDVLDGGALSDWLVGGTGDDILEGGGDADWLTGGTGSDLFVVRMLGNEDGEASLHPHSPVWNADTILDYSSAEDQIQLEGSQFDPVHGNYVADSIEYGTGYEAAKTHALTLLFGDKTYAFVTDKVDGYLFIEPWDLGEISQLEMVGIKLEGLTAVSDFEYNDVGIG
jgi:Ca2+-binding RTX toxin-like protein